MDNNIDISVVIPAFNEAKNIKELYSKVKEALRGLNKTYEIVYVDDGSSDSSSKILKELKKKDDSLKAIIFRKNYGQTAAIDAGIKKARGSIIITMDGDLQNDPSDISLLIEEMEKGYDVVCGLRHKRHDSLLRSLLSKLAYGLRRLLLNDKVHDSGCTLRAYKKECFDDLSFYGEMHRFIPAILAWKGFNIGELKVKHYPRSQGKTKYNLTRVIKGALDLLVLRFWIQYSTRPIHLFGIVGLLLLSTGFICGVYLTIVKLYYGVPLAGRPLLFLAVLLLIVGVQFIVFGVLADIMVQVYYGLNNKRFYSVKETLD